MSGPGDAPSGRPARRRSSFGPVVLAGLAGAGSSAFAASRPWFEGGRSLEGSALPGATMQTGEVYPAASAAGLVLLAAWGVLLVTRGRVRRAFAVIAVAAALGLVLSVVLAGLAPPDLGQDELGFGRAEETSRTVWFWVSAAVSVLAVAPGVLAVRLAPGWPEMGSRYDAPADASAPARSAAQPEEAGERDLWRQLDAGHDPTQDPS